MGVFARVNPKLGTVPRGMCNSVKSACVLMGLPSTLLGSVSLSTANHETLLFPVMNAFVKKELSGKKRREGAWNSPVWEVLWFLGIDAFV